MRGNRLSKVAGYENYKVYAMDWRFLIPGMNVETGIGYMHPGWYLVPGGSVDTKFENDIKLSGESRVWMHPDCKLPKSEVYSRYSKAPDIPSADVVVIPKFRHVHQYSNNSMIAVNEPSKVCVVITYYHHYCGDNYFKEVSDRIEIGKTRLKDLSDLNAHPVNRSLKLPDDMSVFGDAVVTHCGNCTSVTLDNACLVDIHRGVIPESKVMYEDDLQKRMSEGGTMSFEELSSIYEMLASGNADNVSLGLRTLAALPYAKYPHSSVFTLKETMSSSVESRYNWPYSKAIKLTSVNAMLKYFGYCKLHLSYSWRFSEISNDDWQLLKSMMRRYTGYDFYRLNQMPFLKIDLDTDVLTPVLSD